MLPLCPRAPASSKDERVIWATSPKTRGEVHARFTRGLGCFRVVHALFMRGLLCLRVVHAWFMVGSPVPAWFMVGSWSGSRLNQPQLACGALFPRARRVHARARDDRRRVDLGRRRLLLVDANARIVWRGHSPTTRE